MGKQWLHSANIWIDDDGALVVHPLDAVGNKINPATQETQQALLVAVAQARQLKNAAGSVVNPATNEMLAGVAAILAKINALLNPPAATPVIDRFSVGNVSTKLADLYLPEAMQPWCRRVTLKPGADGIFMDDGEATANSYPLGLDTIEISGTPAALGQLQFYAAVPTWLFVVQEG